MDVVLRYKVLEIESERGWGQKEEVLSFATKYLALDFVEKTNAKNNLDYVPDYYIRAEYVGPREFVKIDGKWRELK